MSHAYAHVRSTPAIPLAHTGGPPAVDAPQAPTCGACRALNVAGWAALMRDDLEELRAINRREALHYQARHVG
ncbi:hypothetical protein [Streptomyces sp. UNOC14_S4]|uniref:hypothetical protein n=1 Tax=Streptomyces sp. UNOC14_S4 TaxID=2872340 RepID=UPI001E286D4D|nr:hypothetical protein [Streptomyces sp. UNOC14_S4]MCC3768171.1 hypothetical protein [Streptomyces sp. UNOC14_S4]